jgi:hypothetical protein
MNHQQIMLDLPDNLYEQLQEAAALRMQPLESVLVDSLRLMFGELPDENDLSLSSLDELDDEQLWAIVFQDRARRMDARLETLSDKLEYQQLSQSETLEHKRLLHVLDRYLLLRTKALLLLKQRGYRVEERLQVGA